MMSLPHPLNGCGCFAAGVAMAAFIDDKDGHCYTGAAGRVWLSAPVDTSGGNGETAAAGGRDSVLHAVRSFLSVLFIGAVAPKDIGKIVIFEIVRPNAPGVRLMLAALAFGVEPASIAADSASAAALLGRLEQRREKPEEKQNPR